MTNSYLDELTILKEQLSAEGIFNKAKRKLPLNPQKIAIIIRTGSPLIKDFLRYGRHKKQRSLCCRVINF